MLAILAKLLKVLNSEQSPGQIAAAISFAAIIGLTPLLSLHNLIIALLVLWFSGEFNHVFSGVADFYLGRCVNRAVI